jgi:hypothetical protein
MFQDQLNLSENCPLQVLSSKWSRSRKASAKHSEENSVPARAVIPQNKNFQRNARINDPAGVRDPNLDTLDGRSAALEKSVQDARSEPEKISEGFSYKLKVQNSSQKSVEIVFWEYQFLDTTNPNLTSRRQFLCGVSIGPNKSKDLEGFSFSSPRDVIDIQTLSKQNTLQEKAVINRVEYSDGSIWQRKDWQRNEVKSAYERVLSEPWTAGECKAL